jgi:hypothetical protein
LHLAYPGQPFYCAIQAPLPVLIPLSSDSPSLDVFHPLFSLVTINVC